MGKILEDLCKRNIEYAPHVLLITYLVALIAYYSGVYVHNFRPDLAQVYKKGIDIMYGAAAIIGLTGYVEALISAWKQERGERVLGQTDLNVWCEDEHFQRSLVLLLLAATLAFAQYIGYVGFRTNAQNSKDFIVRLTQQYLLQIAVGVLIFFLINVVKNAAQTLEIRIEDKKYDRKLRKTIKNTEEFLETRANATMNAIRRIKHILRKLPRMQR